MEQPNLKGKVAIVTSSASGIGASTAIGSRQTWRPCRGQLFQEREGSARIRKYRAAGGRRNARGAGPTWRRMKIVACSPHRALVAMGLHRHPGEQRRHDEIRRPYRPRRADRRGLAGDLRRQRRGPIPDDPRLHCAAQGKRRRQRREHLVHRRCRGRRLVHRLCRIERRAQYADHLARPRLRAGDPRQRGVPRLCRHALVQRAASATRVPLRIGDQQAEAATPSSASPMRTTSPTPSCSWPSRPSLTHHPARCWWSIAACIWR